MRTKAKSCKKGFGWGMVTAHEKREKKNQRVTRFRQGKSGKEVTEEKESAEIEGRLV